MEGGWREEEGREEREEKVVSVPRCDMEEREEGREREGGRELEVK